ncbi:hypoxia-inducible factor 1-alpha-like [Notothenia coriiceps]|uniref:Hypoxia-inducible factor 1-alpha-like n=1 Tax=Notothenia coriiceps TaxID=8208 RepID=A0A6I9PI67_9TELE|nr:PREDICTED: hypoxia-inducible factor 1-alpha-like [Notothenia coriiceps]
MVSSVDDCSGSSVDLGGFWPKGSRGGSKKKPPAHTQHDSTRRHNTHPTKNHDTRTSIRLLKSRGSEEINRTELDLPGGFRRPEREGRINRFIHWVIDSNLPLSPDTDSEIQLVKEVPLYNDVMLPSTSDKLALPLSTLPPCEPLHVSTISSEAAKAESFPSSTFTSLRSAEAGSLMDFCFPMDSEMKSDSKLDFVEKLFAIDTDPKNLFTTQAMEDLDLEMLAPYIPMDDDFQLRSLTPEEPLSCGPVKSLQSSPIHITQDIHSYPFSPVSAPGSRTASPALLRAPQTAPIIAMRTPQLDKEVSLRTLAAQNAQRKRKMGDIKEIIGQGTLPQEQVEQGKKLKASESGTTRTILLLPSDMASRLLGCTSENTSSLFSLPHLTRDDCEVNAPLQGRQCLLQGEELLCALDHVNVI